MTLIIRPILRIIIFTLLLAYFALRLLHYHYSLAVYPYPQGLREGAMMVSTHALVHGLNPFAISLQPQFMNQYGIVYPLAVWPWATIFGTTMLVHRSVTAFFLLASCVLVFLVLQRMKVPYLLNFWAVLMLYSSLLFPGTSTPTIDPGATGMFLFLLTVFVPWFCKYSFSSLVISVICGILAFYTKAYFLLGVLIMVSYIFLFNSKFKGLFYGVLLLFLSLISIITVNHLLPAYFDNCFFTSINMAPAWASTERLHEQTVKYLKLHQWTLVMLAAFLAKHVLMAALDTSPGAVKKRMAEIWIRLNFRKFKGPLLKFNFPLALYAAICSSFVLYISLGRNSGAMLWYFFQLLSPFLLICSVWVFSRQGYWSYICLPFLILNLLTMTSGQNYRVFDKNMPGWKEISTLIGSHEHILNTPLIAPLLLEQNKDVVDDGQAEYFGSGAQRPAWMKMMVKSDPRVDYQLFIYFYNIREMVQEKKYDLIILQPGLLPLGVGDDIKKNYKYEGGMMLYAPQDRRSYGITVWKPL